MRLCKTCLSAVMMTASPTRTARPSAAMPSHCKAKRTPSGKTIRELPLAAHYLNNMFIRRNTGKIQDLDPDFVLENGDILVIAGKQEEIISFENWCLQGDI